MLALVLACAVASGGTALAPPREPPTKAAFSSVPRSAVAAGLTLAGAGAAMLWTRRVASDVNTRGRENEATKLVGGALPIGAIGAAGAMIAAGALADGLQPRE